MWAFVFALAVLMWLWTAVSLHLLRWLGSRADVSVQIAYLGVLIALGAVSLLLLPYLILPGSFLSRGWTRDALEKTRQASVLLVAAVSAIGFARVQALLLPAKKAPASAPIKPPPLKKAITKQNQKKRQP